LLNQVTVKREQPCIESGKFSKLLQLFDQPGETLFNSLFDDLPKPNSKLVQRG